MPVLKIKNNGVWEDVAGMSGNATYKVNADWNQNDINAVNYIQNRTHHDGVSHSETKTGEYNSAQNSMRVKFDGVGYSSGNDVYYYEGTTFALKMNVDGRTYTLNYTPNVNSPIKLKGMTGTKAFGNYSWDRVESVIDAESGASVTFDITPYNEEIELECTYSYSTFKQLDEKYIPDTIARVEDVTKDKVGLGNVNNNNITMTLTGTTLNITYIEG